MALENTGVIEISKNVATKEDNNCNVINENDSDQELNQNTLNKETLTEKKSICENSTNTDLLVNNTSRTVLFQNGDVNNNVGTTSNGGVNRRKRRRRSRSYRNKRRKLNDGNQHAELVETNNNDAGTSALDKNESSFAKFGKNFCGIPNNQQNGLKPIYIDGSNIAFGHGKGSEFSVKGLQICINFFKNRGHYVKAFVPQFRLRKKESSDPVLLRKLVNDNLVVVTPTLWIKNERRNPYDDWYIVQAAALNNGVIVSRDGFQDIIKMDASLRTVIEESRLVPTFIDDIIMFPMDPLGRRDTDLNKFLRF